MGCSHFGCSRGHLYPWHLGKAASQIPPNPCRPADKEGHLPHPRRCSSVVGRLAIHWVWVWVWVWVHSSRKTTLLPTLLRTCKENYLLDSDSPGAHSPYMTIRHHHVFFFSFFFSFFFGTNNLRELIESVCHFSSL